MCNESLLVLDFQNLIHVFKQYMYLTPPQALKKQDEADMTQSMLELRQQADYLNTGDNDDLRLTNLNTTAVDDWQTLTADPAGKDKKKKVNNVACLVLWCTNVILSE